MGQEEAEVEGRVAGVGAFEVEQDEPAGMHQDVLGAEVAEDQRALVVRPIHRGDERLDPRRQVRMAAGGGPVIGVDPQLLEEARVGQRPAQGGVRRAVGVDRAQDRTQPAGDLGIDRPSINSDFQVTASSGAQVIAKR